MPAKLTLHPPHRPARFVVIKDGESLSIGRDHRCGLMIEDGRVSKQHARLAWSDGWVLEDTGSKNGTSVNGVPASSKSLVGGEWLSFGGLMGQFERITEEEARTLRSQRLARLQTGLELRRRLGADLDPFDLLLRFLESAMEVTGTDRGFVLLAGPEGRLHVEVAAGFAPGSVRDDTFAGSVGALRRVVETRSSLVVSDAQSHQFLGERPSVVEMGLGVLACVPLLQDECLVGILYVDSRRAGAGFTDIDMSILEALAEHTAIVIGGLQVERRIAALRSSPSRTRATIEQLQERIGPLSLATGDPVEPSPAPDPPVH